MKINLDMSPFLMSEFWRAAGSGSIQHLPSCGLVPASGPSLRLVSSVLEPLGLLSSLCPSVHHFPVFCSPDSSIHFCP